MLEDGEKIPKPSKMDDLANDPNRKNAIAFLVTTDFNKSKTVRVNVTAKENQIEMIDRLARRAGMTRSAYMVQSASSGLAFKKGDESGRRFSNASRRRVPGKKKRESGKLA